MTGKSVITAVEESKFLNVENFDMPLGIRDLAMRFGLDLSLPHADRMDRAAQNLSRSVQYLLASGLDLLSIRSECDHGEFLGLLDAHGFGRNMAYRAITYAQFAGSLPEAERDKVLALPKSKVLELAKADPEVLQDLFEDDAKFDELTALSVRDLRVALRDANAKRTDLSTRNETLERERDRLQEELRVLREGRVRTGGDVPAVVQDIRLECAALHKKALMAVEDVGRLGREFFVNGLPDDSEWNVPVVRHLYGSLASLHAVIGGQLADLHKSFGPRVGGESSVLDTFSPEEATRCALEYRALIQEHDHEAKAREWEREMDRPRKAGRPRTAPKK